jgi:hypothetical protein
VVTAIIAIVIALVPLHIAGGARRHRRHYRQHGAHPNLAGHSQTASTTTVARRIGRRRQRSAVAAPRRDIVCDRHHGPQATPGRRAARPAGQPDA